MDIDAYVAAHRGEWDRLDALVRRAGRRRGESALAPTEVDELVGLYQRVATHLSVVRASSPDPALLGRLSTLVARARSVVTGVHSPALREIARFFVVVYPAALRRALPWWASVGAVCTALSFLVGAWVAGNPTVQRSIAAPEDVRRLVDQDFANYYSSHPAGSFAAKVATNNAEVTALVLAFGIFLVPVVYLLWTNTLNVAVAGGLMVANHRGGLFFGLILPHGLLELTCVFVAGGAGLRLWWTLVDPGGRSRSDALREEGLAAGALALGLAVTLMVSGVLEAFVTPSGLPTWARVSIGATIWLAFLAYVLVLGGRAVRAGETGGVDRAWSTDVAPVSG